MSDTHPISVKIGKVLIGNNYPIAVQSMTNTSTSDVDATIEQCIRIFEAGGKMVRVTVQNLHEIESLRMIREQLFLRGYDFPLVADVHFNPKIAEEAAKVVEKIRINPGNYTDKKSFREYRLTDEEYANGLQVIREKIKPLLDICRERKTVIRIGVNHGSLSDRIMNRYGDTPEGMAESAMDFIRICCEENYRNLVISMKASNARVMVYAVRLLVAKMNMEKTIFPIHLGVTEAGAGTEGRIRSSVGIAALLQEGIGDTIRVSLTEDPEEEIPVARELASYFSVKKIKSRKIVNPSKIKTAYNRRKTDPVLNTGGNNQPVVITDLNVFLKDISSGSRNSLQTPDFIFTEQLPPPDLLTNGRNWIIPYNRWIQYNHDQCFPAGNTEDANLYYQDHSGPFFLFINPQDICPQDIEIVENQKNIIIVADCMSSPDPSLLFNFFSVLDTYIPRTPVIIKKNFELTSPEKLLIRASGETGLLFLDGLADGIWLRNKGNKMPLIQYSFEILQASRARISSTEFISCPSCGRTQFDIQTVLRNIKKNTRHLTGLKIAVMGCVVNGPGEMADADYGYVGAGPGKITLYRGKNPVIKHIPENEAIHHLISLIKKDGKWKSPE